MQLDPSNTASPCAFMAVLIDLLGEPPMGRDRRRADTVTERLDRLEYEARCYGAPDTTMTAIQGARALLGMAGLPPERRP